jgi:signal transduction histidine kinase
VEIEIQDTGAGIPPEVQDKIFLPFFTTKEKGTGLGLAIVHKIILSHNGQIQVDSQEGKGTTFRVYLPYEGEG